MSEIGVAEASAELTGRRWAFGAAVLDERTLELHVDGQLVPLERKPLEVLLYLLHHAGEVVTKDDLTENLWPGRILTETVLTRCISLLRQALKDSEKTVIRTVHGFGYRLVADVRVEAAPAAKAPAFDFRPGDHPPLRPQWKLVERLGTGGHGEAWLARHEKTGDARVFKFALDAAALVSLKREITLYRLLHDSLGAKAAIVRVLEWNLAEPPYFIEMEHIAGGNLQSWSDAQGGLAAMPLQGRLDLVAQIADALAAAHSVGALHKDLKPGNVLVDVSGGAPSIRLCDFGSGGVLDPKRLEALGITRLGFTKTLADSKSATPIYVAPEVVRGQPFTVQADIYSLGVLLYQVITGDLRRTLAPGWESDVADELLREDIAQAAAGNPEKRLTDAGQLADRLRMLAERREQKRAELAARQRADRARQTLAALRRTRTYVLLLLGLTGVAGIAGVMAYQARNKALDATATAEALTGFLMEDVLRVDSSMLRPADASYNSLLDRASSEIGKRLAEQPRAAASIHWMLGRRYQEIGQYTNAEAEYERAFTLFRQLDGRVATSSLMALDRLAWIYLENGRIDEALALAAEMRTLWQSRLHPSNLAMLAVRARVARIHVAAGLFSDAEDELQKVIKESSAAEVNTDEARVVFKQWLGTVPFSEASAAQVLAAYAQLLLYGYVLEELGTEYAQVEAGLRHSIDIFSRHLGEKNELVAFARVPLVGALGAIGKYAEAEELAIGLRDYFDSRLPAHHFGRGIPWMIIGRLRMEQRRLPEAEAAIHRAIESCARDDGCPPRVRAEFQWDLGRLYSEQGRHETAVSIFRSTLVAHEKQLGPNHLFTLRVRVNLADSLRALRNYGEARTTLAAISEEAELALRPFEQAKGDLRRAQGLLSLELGLRPAATAALQEVVSISESRLGASHWRTERARSELAAAQATP